jgi:hypothetical protein
MDRFEAPPKPDDFETTVKEHREAVAKNIKQKKKPKFDKKVWGKYKDHLAAQQHGRCGFCDSKVTSTQYGDVEHYRPKSEVSRLSDDERTWGREVPNSAKVKGRKPIILSKRGYWWLAYGWENYLLCCQVCNQQWKGCIFPLHNESRRSLPPSKRSRERPLLLNPFHGPDPAKHLKFNADGTVEPWRGSKYGRETILACGLYRAGLREDREEKASKAYELLSELDEAGDKEKEDILRRFFRLGNPKYSFAGIVRAILEQNTDLTWKDMKKMFDEG